MIALYHGREIELPDISVLRCDDCGSAKVQLIAPGSEP